MGAWGEKERKTDAGKKRKLPFLPRSPPSVAFPPLLLGSKETETTATQPGKNAFV